MYLLDTTVISELRRPDKADRNIVSWAPSVPAAQFYLHVISILEIDPGTLLRAWIDMLVLPTFTGRILPMIQRSPTVARRSMCPILRPSLLR